ncbi:single-stranded DNA-binding protein [Bacillus sp. DNRA2]|uniref:DUF1413 domain-containing protein n=1 Tax=Bacillus sp. DNRA2 TaxID=2723053 RepID=UPI00145FCA14|nr:DUF1413 domain-containing protein [Bacillus sp. DNRA2]NMD72796.1 single-stranded DNA-binding protein [Bacillus sp. DNRA2]
MDMVKVTLREIKPGENFVVKDLFRGFEWNRISRGNRTKLGSLFISYSYSEGKDLIERFGKTPQNQMMYQKRKEEISELK